MKNNITCPLCNSEQNPINKVANYPDMFLSCKSIILCKGCNLIFASPLPNSEELNQYYKCGLYYDKTTSPFEIQFLDFSLKLSKSRLRLINKKISLKVDLKIIDIGAGNAQFSAALNELNDEFVYDVVEPDSNVSDQYGDLVSNHYNEISQVNKNSYDLAVLNQVLEHVSDPVEFLSSVSELIRERGYVYIDVPYQDYIFKPSVDPHILFWNKKSLSTLLEKVGFKILFCDTAGMPHRTANRFFNKQSFLQKLTNSWLYKAKINSLISNIGILKPFDTFKQFQSENYGGDRQWLRCIAQKIN